VLLSELEGALGPLGSYELIFIDDGSSDGSLARLASLSAFRPRLRVLRHRRNAGQSAALASGIRAARAS
jgi:glycosyltransferase involved in cell wall biosynthesis